MTRDPTPRRTDRRRSTAVPDRPAARESRAAGVRHGCVTDRLAAPRPRDRCRSARRFPCASSCPAPALSSAISDQLSAIGRTRSCRWSAVRVQFQLIAESRQLTARIAGICQRRRPRRCASIWTPSNSIATRFCFSAWAISTRCSSRTLWSPPARWSSRSPPDRRTATAAGSRCAACPFTPSTTTSPAWSRRAFAWPSAIRSRIRARRRAWSSAKWSAWCRPAR